MKPHFALTLLGLLLPILAIGGETENAIVQKVTNAYGGDLIRNLQSYVLTKKYLGVATGQSHTPHLDDIGEISQRFAHDIANGKASFDGWFDNRGGRFQTRIISDGEEGWNINYAAKTWGARADGDVYGFGGGVMRTNDAILAHELYKARESVEHLGTADYMNRPHEQIKMPFPQSPDLTLYVDAETGLISRMVRQNPQLGQLDYVFGNHTTTDGITYATTSDFFIAGKPNLITVQHSADFNVNLDASEFELPDQFEAEAERVDASEMTASKISDAVYHVGQNNAFTLFIDADDGLIATGGGAGLNARLEHYRAETGNYRPLAYQIVTHHHWDHLVGVADAVALNATVVTVDSHVDAIKASVDTLPDTQILTVEDRLTFGKGRDRVEIFEVGTIHAARFLVTYVPREQLLFIADHFNSPYIAGVPVANLNTVSMHEALQELDIEIDEIAVAHGRRIYTWRDMESSVRAFEPTECLANRPVCPSS